MPCLELHCLEMPKVVLPGFACLTSLEIASSGIVLSEIVLSILAWDHPTWNLLVSLFKIALIEIAWKSLA